MKESVIHLENAFNRFPISTEEIDELVRTHRTIFQNITRFCVYWLAYVGTHPVNSDARNEASVELAHDLYETPGVPEILNRAIPYI